MIEELRPSYENVKRAQRKFAELKSLIGRYIESGPHRIRTESHAKTTYVIRSLERDPPDDVAWETVEIVQRIRIALDKAMVALVERNGRGTSGVGFPFGGLNNETGQPNPFPDNRMTGKHGIIQKLTAAQWDLIAAYKPYPRGNDTLWAINEIANSDKHRKELVEARARLGQDNFNLFRADGTQSFTIHPTDVPVPYDKERETVFLAVEGGSGNFDAKHSFAVEVVFGEIAPVTGGNVLVTLNQQIRLVQSILKGMGTLFR